jgi:hypothetical protein
MGWAIFSQTHLVTLPRINLKLLGPRIQKPDVTNDVARCFPCDTVPRFLSTGSSAASTRNLGHHFLTLTPKPIPRLPT